MRTILRASIIAASVAVAAAAASAQQPTQCAEDDFVCIFTGESADTELEEVADAPDTKGARLVRRDTAASTPAPTRGNVGIRATRTVSAASTPQTVRTAPPVRHLVRQGTSATVRPGNRADLRLTFELGSAVMTARAEERARNFARQAQDPRLASRRFRIEGHTDSIGGRDYNLDLSRRRAQAVAEFLVSLGVSRERLDVEGYGFDRPISGTSAAAPQNRRVEAVLIS
jgi:outer membrane protein OmpA-like peptidoglycan-associated protein